MAGKSIWILVENPGKATFIIPYHILLGLFPELGFAYAAVEAGDATEKEYWSLLAKFSLMFVALRFGVAPKAYWPISIIDDFDKGDRSARYVASLTVPNLSPN